MQKSKIEWTDFTWNPITGCTKGCDYCYARKMAENPYYRKAFPNKFEPTFYTDRLKEIENHSGHKIFVCSMGELFATGHENWTAEILNRIKLYPHTTFQLLTKQPQNLKKWSPFPDNCWVGVSATNEEMFVNAVVHNLGYIEAKVKFISLEPLLDWEKRWYHDNYMRQNGINWLIIGQQTPVRPATTPKLEWIREIVEAADKGGVKVFLKDNLNSYEISDYPELLDKHGNLRQEFPKG